MSRSGKNTTFEMRQLVLMHNARGESQRTIAKLLNIPQSTVSGIILRLKREDRIESTKYKGAVEKLTAYDRRFIRREVKKNPRISAPKLVTQLRERGTNVTAQTVRNAIRNVGYNSRTARCKPYISPVNQRKRFEFAEKYFHEDETFWKTVLFTDESKFNVFASDGKIKVWRKPNTEFALKNLKASVKHGGGGVSVWGCCGANGVGNLAFVEGNMDHKQYIEILKNNLHASAEKLGIRETFKLYQDNDPKHKAWNTRMWLLYNCPKVLETPPQSPDCNIIENVWEYVDRRLRERPISNKQQLRERLLEEWAEIPAEYVRNLVASMPRRMKAVYDAKGLHTKY